MEHKFSKNSRYYTIGIYAIVFILIATICIKLVWNWDETSSFLGALLDVVQPFLIGLLIAYFINPLAKLISRKLLKNTFKIKSHGVRKVLSVLIAYIIVISAIVTAMFYIVPQIVESLSQLTNFIDTAQTGYGKIMNKLQELNEKYPQWKLDGVIDMIKGIPSLITDFIKNTVPTLLPTLYVLIFGGSWYPLLFLGDLMLHMAVDDLKANKKKINLIQDQTIHLVQIIWTWFCYAY